MVVPLLTRGRSCFRGFLFFPCNVFFFLLFFPIAPLVFLDPCTSKVLRPNHHFDLARCVGTVSRPRSGSQAFPTIDPSSVGSCMSHRPVCVFIFVGRIGQPLVFSRFALLWSMFHGELSVFFSFPKNGMPVHPPTPVVRSLPVESLVILAFGLNFDCPLVDSAWFF